MSTSRRLPLQFLRVKRRPLRTGHDAGELRKVDAFSQALEIALYLEKPLSEKCLIQFYSIAYPFYLVLVSRSSSSEFRRSSIGSKDGS